MKKNGIVLVAFIAASVIAAFVVRNTFFEENNINNYTTVEMLQKEELIIDNYATEEDFSEEELKIFVESECEAVLDSEYVFKVSPTGNLYFNNSVIMQEVLVDSVIVGQCKNQKIWICCEGSTITDNKNNTYSLIGLDYSLMQPECQYLVFCMPSEINEYSKEKVYHIDDSLWFSYYNITKDSEKMMENEYYDKEIEFYTDSEKILGCFNQLKIEIFKMLEIS